MVLWQLGHRHVRASGRRAFKMATGVDLTHVPYRATPAIMTDLLEGRIQMSVLGVADCRQYILSGQLRGLALSHSERMQEFPDLPTFAEVGLSQCPREQRLWCGDQGRHTDPDPGADGGSLPTAVRRPEIVQRLADVGLIVVGTSSAEFNLRFQTRPDTAKSSEWPTSRLSKALPLHATVDKSNLWRSWSYQRMSGWRLAALSRPSIMPAVRYADRILRFCGSVGAKCGDQAIKASGSAQRLG